MSQRITELGVAVSSAEALLSSIGRISAELKVDHYATRLGDVDPFTKECIHAASVSAEGAVTRLSEAIERLLSAQANLVRVKAEAEAQK